MAQTQMIIDQRKQASIEVQFDLMTKTLFVKEPIHIFVYNKDWTTSHLCWSMTLHNTLCANFTFPSFPHRIFIYINLQVKSEQRPRNRTNSPRLVPSSAVLELNPSLTCHRSSPSLHLCLPRSPRFAENPSDHLQTTWAISHRGSLS